MAVVAGARPAHPPKRRQASVVDVFPNEYAKVQRAGRVEVEEAAARIVRISHGRFRLHNYVY